MRIAQRDLGPGFEPYIIAEIGVNHDGSRERALEMVDLAARAGADAVKLQFFRADLLLSREAILALYQKDAGADDPFEMLRALELSVSDLRAIVERARGAGVHAIATVFSADLVEEAESVGWDAYKVASPDVINKPLIDALKATGRPIIASTGASTAEEIQRAAGWLSGRDFALLHCVSAYPTEDDFAALAGIRAIESLVDAPVGYSDHTASTDTGGYAVAAGATIIEKHLTHDRAAEGPDHAASLEPQAFHEYVRLARRAWRMVGPPGKSVQGIEQDVRRVSRQSIVSRRGLETGPVLSAGDVTVKRPGTGIEPWRMEEIIGRTLARDVDADTPLREEDLA